MTATLQTHWNLDQLKSRLSQDKQVKGWAILREHLHRRERYFLLDQSALGVDQDREVSQENIQARIFVRLPKNGRQGEISKKFFTHQPLGPQLESAIEAALQTDHQAWELPAAPRATLPELKTADPRMAEDLNGVMDEATARIARAVEEKRTANFNSSELFLSVHHREQHFSNGLTHRSSQSRIYLESAYSFARPGRNRDGRTELLSDEYLNARWSVNLDDLGVEGLFSETAERAQHSLECPKPVAGRYAVLIDAEVLATLFNGHLSQLSASNSYNGLPFLKPGSEFIPGASGELITMTLDPLLDFGADTAALSDQGILQAMLPLVQDNRVIATLADKQYADYLGIHPTTVRGNVVIAPGTLSYDELTSAEPQVLEILQFSGLFADPNSGTFSSEIRLARLHDRDKRTITYLKGGSLSGSINENFRNARFSKKLVRHAHFASGSPYGQGYHGPEFALLSDVSIAG